MEGGVRNGGRDMVHINAHVRASDALHDLIHCRTSAELANRAALDGGGCQQENSKYHTLGHGVTGRAGEDARSGSSAGAFMRGALNVLRVERTFLCACAKVLLNKL